MYDVYVNVCYSGANITGLTGSSWLQRLTVIGRFLFLLVIQL